MHAVKENRGGIMGVIQGVELHLQYQRGHRYEECAPENKEVVGPTEHEEPDHLVLGPIKEKATRVHY